MDYATGPRGACHVSSLTLNIELGASSFPGLGLMAGDLPAQSGEGKAALVKKAQDLGTIFLGAAMFCALGGIPFDEEDLVSALRLATGFDYDLAELMSSGERVWMEKRLLNLRRGLTRADDHLPRVHNRPLESGPAAGSLPDMSLLLEEYYRRRGLDPATGWPTPAKLKELGLILWPVTNYTGTIWSSNRLDR
ncbi:MAG: aldehyde ferredoxin oxidoreductase C-terminal domain-containing protein [Firmicutes bacterium]|nr:aldehyde ferredoxin oxidoreductase C-terminal domain-containing protein [Bacillota bacterium]MCL5040060.1 aldehyde ferredoxin oxidoreductase C-terminal domain-containing protein [Bacillota bacterium]